MAKDTDQFIRDALNEIRDHVKEVDSHVDAVDKTLAEYKVTFEHHTQQDELMYEEFKRMNNILQENTESLKQHMKRTALLEETVVKMDQRLEPIELERIKKQAVNSWLMSRAVIIAKIIGVLDRKSVV